MGDKQYRRRNNYCVCFFSILLTVNSVSNHIWQVVKQLNEVVKQLWWQNELKQLDMIIKYEEDDDKIKAKNSMKEWNK